MPSVARHFRLDHRLSMMMVATAALAALDADERFPQGIWLEYFVERCRLFSGIYLELAHVSGRACLIDEVDQSLPCRGRPAELLRGEVKVLGS